jgi:Mg2+-importing ATPase
MPSAAIHAAARDSAPAVLAVLAAGPDGLSTDEAVRRRARHGPNVLREQERQSRLRLLARAAGNPLVVLLAILAASALAVGDRAAAAVMLAMTGLGVGLRFVREARADDAAAALRAMIRVHATVRRDGAECELPIAELVPGDVVHLAASDMVPADVRLLSSRDLAVSQAIFTGESFPVDKSAAAAAAGDDPPAWPTVCLMGASVESGTATAVVVATGRRTFLGREATSLELPELPTAFDRGLRRFTWLMIGLVAVMAPLVFVVNGLTKGDWWQALLFALAAAVGLTPEMLPMIVTVCLSRGALAMADKRVIVKHLESIQNLGAMDMLCTDKTGTLTADRIILERHCDVRLRDDPETLRLAWLNAHFQTGLKNLLDRAILDHERFREHVPHAGHEKLDEIPFDFARRLMSVVVTTPGGVPRLICKGAVESVFARCTAYELDGTVHRLDAATARELTAACEGLGDDGFRVLAVASRDLPLQAVYAPADERDLVLRGYVAFLDPPKDSARAALAALAADGVAVKVLTGDTAAVARKICREVGIDPAGALAGDEVERLDDAGLAAALGKTALCTRLTPAQKERIVRVLETAGHVVGFLGDGVNDAPALRAADVGLTVDRAVDIARESADCILLDKDLRVLHAGVLEGRRVFVNVLKYVRMGASSNFGNMFSVVAASAIVPFLPMTPLQILTNNLLYDCCQIPIPGDAVDAELVARPRPWSMGQIARYVLLLGPCSSLFDAVTFAVLLLGFGCADPARAGLFQTGWFVESLLTQTLVIHVIRTDRIPVIQSRASLALSATTAAVMLVGLWLPASPLGPLFGFVPLPAALWPVLAAIVAAYAVSAFGLKAWLVRHGWIE